MRYLIHGDNIVQSRQYLTDLIDKFTTSPDRETIYLDGRKLEETQVIQALQSTSLFGSKRLVVIEQLFQHPSKNTKKSVVTHLTSSENYTASIVLWENKLITANQLKPLNTFTQKLFKTAPLIFKFLDALEPGQPKNSLKLLKKVLQTEAPELVLYMLARHSRSMLLVSADQFKGPSWQRGKLKRQADQLGLPQIISLHNHLTDLDWRTKTGQSAFGLAAELELLVAQI